MTKEFFSSNEFKIEEFNRNDIRDEFYARVDKIYQDAISTDFNLLSEDFLNSFERIFDVERELSKMQFTMESISKILTRF
jgi:hypothetical protein